MSKSKFEAVLAEDIMGFYADPVGYARYAFPWGTGELGDEEGLDEWQEEILGELGAAAAEGRHAQVAVASGHGIGKSALMSILILWFMSTRPNAKVVITANSRDQLSGKTWAEVAKWHKLAINSHWFKYTATRLYKTGVNKKGEDYSNSWFAHAALWSETNTDAFAGLHGKHTLMLYDEAAGIPESIWEVSSGFMTDPLAMWVVFGNPTQNSGGFYDCFHRQESRWFSRQIDSRAVKRTDKDFLNALVEDYGEDSDIVRRRVTGRFPRSGYSQFISAELVDECVGRELDPGAYEFMPAILGVDVARFGDDLTVICLRRGRKVYALMRHDGLNAVEVANEVADQMRMHDPMLVCVDGIGIGAGVVDHLRYLGYDNIVDVNVAKKARKTNEYLNRRAEIWGDMRAAMAEGLSLPRDSELEDELKAIEYGYTESTMVIQLESKKDMKKRIRRSPDAADALALTFAENVVEESFEEAAYEDEVSACGVDPITGY